eukprot:NODE_153_length_16933_cov_0.442141.p13 type:complete len:108 gc:universal NODE_153_length_16933_cov_0.442141:4706-5029(+)
MIHCRTLLNSSSNLLKFVRAGARNIQNLNGVSYPSKVLRKMPFTELHALYHVLLKERNLLESMKLNCKLSKTIFMEADNLSKVKLSMNRVLQVVGQRREVKDTEANK